MKRLCLIFAASLTALLIVAQPGFGQTKNSIPSDTKIVLERTACFGSCPIYKLTISADGTVEFEGKDFVQVKGNAKGKISTDAVHQLVVAFDEIKYFSLD